MKINVILKENTRDTFLLDETNSYYLNSVFSENFKLQNPIVEHNIYSYLTAKNHFKLCPNNTLVADFMNIAISVYAIDQSCNRAKFGYQGWSRFLSLHIPVYNINNWNSVKESFESMLSYLSGDKWILNFRACEESFPEFVSSTFRPTQVSLFSGGMDSFIGISDLIKKGESLATVSHYKGGNSGELSIQRKIINNLKNSNIAKDILPYNFRVQAKKNADLSGEKTQRARSMLFLSLGLLVANSSSETTPIIIPENGLISLNLPLSPARGGSHSTKTTHPKFLSELNKIFETVGIQNRIENPYRFLTKGEMFNKVKDNDFVLNNIKSTLSCSKPGYYRQWKKNRKANEDIKIQCGHCVPCIIRRAALFSNNLDDSNDYEKNVKNSNEKFDDYNAFKLAVHRYSTIDSIRLAFLKSGHMDIEEKEITGYIEMYKRGIKEVDNFMSR